MPTRPWLRAHGPVYVWAERFGTGFAPPNDSAFFQRNAKPLTPLSHAAFCRREDRNLNPFLRMPVAAHRCPKPAKSRLFGSSLLPIAALCRPLISTRTLAVLAPSQCFCVYLSSSNESAKCGSQANTLSRIAFCVSYWFLSACYGWLHPAVRSYTAGSTNVLVKKTI